MSKQTLTEQQAIALLKYWQQQGNSVVGLPRVVIEQKRLHIALPDYASNQWLLVQGQHSSYQEAMAVIGRFLDRCVAA